MACHLAIIEAKRRGCFPDQGQILTYMAMVQAKSPDRRLGLPVLPAKYRGRVVSLAITDEERRLATPESVGDTGTFGFTKEIES